MEGTDIVAKWRELSDKGEGEEVEEMAKSEEDTELIASK